MLADAEILVREAGLSTADLEAIAVGTGPGSFTGLRIGLAAARGLSLALGIPVAGVPTLAALAAGSPGALPVIDARRGEVFMLVGGEPAAVDPERLKLEPAGTVCVGDGAVSYRALLEEAGARVPPDGSDLHTPWARFHVLLAHDFGPAELVQPIYVRPPDAVRRAGAPSMTPSIEIRRLELRDLGAVEEIEERSYPTPWSRSMFAGEIAKPSSLCLGAFDSESGALAGYLIVSRYVDAWHVMNVAVAPDYRRHGIAKRLLNELFALTDEDGRRGYTLEVRVSNADAIRLYEQMGFQARGVRRGYYTDNREDALIMWRDPTPQPAAS